MKKFNNINEAFNNLVPFSGECETNRGEIVRAFMRLSYRWYNDGDEPGEGYGNETCNSSVRYLNYIVPSKYADRLPLDPKYPSYTEDPNSDDFWPNFESLIMEFINDDEYTDFLEAKNEHDSRGDEFIRQEDYMWTSEEDEDDEDECAYSFCDYEDEPED